MRHSRDAVLVTLLSLVGALWFICGVVTVVEADVGPGDAPVKLTNAVQGACPKRELTSERGCIIPPHIKKRVTPRFPKSARPGQDLGSVVLGATVEVDGTVGPIEVLKSTNPGHGFEASAIEAMKKRRADERERWTA